MIKENIRLDEVPKYNTKDLATAAYLKVKGVPLEVEVITTPRGKRGKFLYDRKFQSTVDDFYKGDGQFLEYSMNLRSLKSEIHNKRGGEQ